MFVQIKKCQILNPSKGETKVEKIPPLQTSHKVFKPKLQPEIYSNFLEIILKRLWCYLEFRKLPTTPVLPNGTRSYKKFLRHRPDPGVDKNVRN